MRKAVDASRNSNSWKPGQYRSAYLAGDEILSAVDSAAVIDATPTDAATSGNQFSLTDATTGEWHFNLNTKALSVGT